MLSIPVTLGNALWVLYMAGVSLVLYILLDWVLKVFKLLLEPFKEGICFTCKKCTDTLKCRGLTVWFEEDCIKQRKRNGLT